jgi:putative peptidoglycan lipid II flippase
VDQQSIRPQGLNSSPQGAPAQKPPSVLRAAGAMGIATLMSRVLGLVREQVFAIMFGAGNMTDAFNVAFRIPNLLRDLFAEGAMSASLVPTFTRARKEEGDRRAWRVAGLVFRVLAITVGIIAALGVVFAPQLVSVYASAFRDVPGKFELTVRMTRTMFPFFPLVAVAAAFMGILNACGVFFLPAFSSALFNLASIVVGVIFAQVIQHTGLEIGGWKPLPIEGMAIGVLAGGLVQALCQLPALYRAGYQWQKREPQDPTWREDPHLRRMLWMMVPGTIGLAATQVNLLVNTVLATSQGPGAVSWLNYAFRLMQFPIGVFGVSLASATLPRVSKQWVERDVRGVQETLTQSLRHVFAINLPASAGLAFLGAPIIAMIFQYGRFSADDTAATAFALAMYSVGLTAYSAVKVLVPSCYALGNTRVPVISSFFAVGVTVCLNLLMVRPFGYWGLALGTSIAAVLNCVFLLRALKRMLQEAGGAFPMRPLIEAFGKHLCVALVMGAVVHFSYRGLDLVWPDQALGQHFGGFAGKIGLVLSRLMKVSLVMLESVVLILGLGKAFGISDTVEAVDIFAKKLKNKLRRKRS